MELNKAFRVRESYLAQAQGSDHRGRFDFIVYTVINLISSVEDTFNDIWQIQKSRPWYRKISDYLALFLVLPVLMTASSGLSIFMSTLQNSFLGQYLFFYATRRAVLAYSALYYHDIGFHGAVRLLAEYESKVRERVGGRLYRWLRLPVVPIYLYQWADLGEQTHNAIYGSFAALPLLLLWLQLSWLICLFGAELSYASQNVKKFSFEEGQQSISRRYKDFLTLLIASLIVKRFVKGEKPYTADRAIRRLPHPYPHNDTDLIPAHGLNIIIEVNYGNDDRVAYYQPAIDVNKITVSYLLTRMDEYGSENFKIDTSKLFSKEWKALLKTREDMIKANDNILLKDL